MKRLEAVSLDVTGTLIHCPSMGEIYAEVLGRHGVEVTAEDVRRTFRVVWQELDCLTPAGGDRFSTYPGGSRAWWGRLIERLCELLEAGRPSPFAVAELYHRFEDAESWQLYADTLEALDRLRSLDLRLAVVSNFDERLPVILSGLGLAPRFDAVVVSSELGVAKPNPLIFRSLLDRLDLAAPSVAHLGNSPREDVEGAEAAGLFALLVRRSDENDPGLLRAVSQLVARRAG
ncbi:MAG: HAD-IA family hydrolase [Thermoanaerobaculia bacterium]|nr:HAD-IA family hydrolase [Thermoanaerobaculia bacterium]